MRNIATQIWNKINSGEKNLFYIILEYLIQFNNSKLWNFSTIKELLENKIQSTPYYWHRRIHVNNMAKPIKFILFLD